MASPSEGDLADKFWSQLQVMDPEAHPSAQQIIEKEGPAFTLKGKVALVTGGSSGIGIETVRVLAAAGAKVFVLVRDVEKTKPILAQIAHAHPDVDLHTDLQIVRADLDDLASVRAAADEVLRKTTQLNILINNAGVMCTPYQRTKDGHEYQFGVNHLAHFALTHALLPLLVRSSTPAFRSRVVILSSSGHRFGTVDLSDIHFEKRGYTPSVSYGQSKTANILMARELDKRYGDQGVHAWAVHPGGIKTDLGRTMTWQDLIEIGAVDEKGESRWAKAGFKLKSVPQGAATSVWAAVSAELEGKGGGYLADARVGEALAHAQDDALAHALWEYSEKVVAV